MFRLIKAIRPRWVIAENVAGHIGMGLDDVLSDLEREGYAWWPFVIPACAVDAKHRRDRVWIIANAISERRRPDARARQRTKDESEELSEQTRLSLSDDPAEACRVISDTRHTESPGREKLETDHDRCSGARIQEGSQPAPPCSSVADPQSGGGGRAQRQ